MSETTETKAVTSTKAKGEIGPSMLGSEILVKALEEEACGVDTWRNRFETMCKRVSARARASQPPRHRLPRRSHSPRRARAW